MAVVTDRHFDQPRLQAMLAIMLLIAIAWIANWVAKRLVSTLVVKLLEHLPFALETQHLGSIVARLSNIVPALIFQLGIESVPHLPGWTAHFIRSLCAAFIILTITIALSSGLGLMNDLYQRRPRP